MLKKIFLIVTVLCLAFFVSACTKNEADKNGPQNQAETTDNQVVSDDLQALSLASDLPACPADTSGLFTKPFIDGDYPDYIVPLGNSNVSGHVVPVDHIYPIQNDFVANLPIYMPGDTTLVWVEIKQYYFSATDQYIGPDYLLSFAPCRGINLIVNHITGISEKLKAAIDEESQNCLSETTRNDEKTYYKICHPSFDKVKMLAGESMGSIGNFPDKMNYGIDIGLYNYNSPALAFANQDRYNTATLHTSCITEYYTPELRAKYEAKFGGLVSQRSDEQTFLQRTAEPVCGKVLYDEVGTAAGNWYDHPVKVKNVTDNDALILMHDNLQPALGKINIAGVLGFTFTPLHSGQYNREFSEVTADGTVYCYSREEQNVKEKVLLQLIDENHMKVEKLESACGSNETFINPTNYER